jgi:hypothetical protein
MKYQLRNTSNNRRTQLRDLESSAAEPVELTELDDEMLRRVTGGGAPNSCTACEDLDFDK